MNKKSFAIIGSPITHSLSPVLHNYWFKKYNIDAEYDPLDIDKSEIQNVIDKIKNKANAKDGDAIFFICNKLQPIVQTPRKNWGRLHPSHLSTKGPLGTT